MRYRTFGRTGLYVSELCMGAMSFGGLGRFAVMGSLDQKTSQAIVERALAAGINFIDTADVYSHGQSEEIVGRSLKALGVKRSEVVVATKCANQMSESPNDRGASRGHIMDSVKQSLERLQLDHIDLYQVHTDDAVTPVEEIVRALDDLVSQGLVRYVGVSNWQAWKIAKALGIAERRGWARFETVQAYYSIAGRDLERELVPMMASEGLGALIWSPLAGGLLSGKEITAGTRRADFDFPPVNRERAAACVAVMREIAEARGITVARVALAWVLAKPFVTSVIIGARRLEQLEDNLAAVHVQLTPEETARLEEVSALPKEYPGWMIEAQGPGRIPKPFESR